MRTTRTYYEILGVPRSATAAQIRRRYKELVRKYHPDVAADKEMAHRLFLQIREAYETLSDSVRRKAYDGILDARNAAKVSPPPKPKPRPAAEHIKDAQWAFIQRRLSEAASHCREAIRVEPQNAKAHAVLGDIYRAQGKLNSAIREFSLAVQFNPQDRESQRKLERLLRKTPIAAAVGHHTRVGNVSRTSMQAIWWSVAFFLILMIGVRPGQPIEWLNEYVPYVSLWSVNLIVLMIGASIVVGMLLSRNGLLSHPDEELVFENTTGNWAIVPTGLILLIGSGFFFVGAAAFYIVVGLIQGSLSRSVLIVFAAVAGVVVLSSIVYRSDAMEQVLLFGGNLSFLAMLFGWYLGAMSKPLDGS